MAHVCNSSYLGVRDQEDGNSSQSRQKVNETHISTNSWVQWFVFVTLSMQEAEIRRIEVLGQHGQKSL
jgi:hypothetical protein